MVAVRVGVGLTQRHQPELARELEALGFDGLWVGGHVLWHASMLDPLVQLAAYAAATSRIRLGTRDRWDVPAHIVRCPCRRLLASLGGPK